MKNLTCILLVIVLILTGCTEETITESLTPSESLMEMCYDSLKSYSYYSNNIDHNYDYYTTPTEMFYSAEDLLKGNYYTYYINPTDLVRYEAMFDIEPEEGFGVILSVVSDSLAEDTLFIDKVFSGSPAESAGLKEGDRIISVDGYPVYGSNVIFKGLTESSKNYSFVTLRDGVSNSVTVRKSEITLPVCYSDSLTPDVGYIYLSTFIADDDVIGGSSSEQFTRSFNETKDYPVTIIDLRYNGGGYLYELDMITHLFLDESDTVALYTVSEEQPVSSSYVYSVENDTYANTSGSTRKFVLLANEYSASASELLIVALQHNLDVPLVGSKTYGKAIAQGGIDFTAGGGGIGNITFARFTSGSGEKYASTGIVPDYSVENSLDSDEDKQLLKAIQVAESLLGSRSLRSAEVPSDLLRKSAMISEVNKRMHHTSPKVSEVRCGDKVSIKKLRR